MIFKNKIGAGIGMVGTLVIMVMIILLVTGFTTDTFGSTKKATNELFCSAGDFDQDGVPDAIDNCPCDAQLDSEGNEVECMYSFKLRQSAFEKPWSKKLFKKPVERLNQEDYYRIKEYLESGTPLKLIYLNNEQIYESASKTDFCEFPSGSTCSFLDFKNSFLMKTTNGYVRSCRTNKKECDSFRESACLEDVSEEEIKRFISC